MIYASTTSAGALSFLPGGPGVNARAVAMLLVSGFARLDRGRAPRAARLATLWFTVLVGLVVLVWLAVPAAVFRRAAGMTSARDSLY